jgi:putative DNA primase/helicase
MPAAAEVHIPEEREPSTSERWAASLQAVEAAPAEGESAEAAKKPRKSQATILVELAREQGADLFSFNDEPYATFRNGDHVETARLRAPAFRRWLQRQYWQAFSAAPGSQGIVDALGTLEGLAMFGGEVHAVYTRIAPDGEGGIWIDLGDQSWSTVRITAAGWQIETGAPVRFMRPSGMLALPVPRCGGTLEELRTFWPVNDPQFRLAVTYLLQSERPLGPYAGLETDGAQGSGKTFFLMGVKRLIDPNLAPVRSAPRDEVDLIIAARGSRLPCFDNLSRLSEEMSDALCRMATGSGIGKRTLYSDLDETLAWVCSPFAFNGITPTAIRSDLIDRLFRITLSPIPEDHRLTPSEYWARWTAREPFILGALYTTLAAVLAILPTMERPSRLPRLAEIAMVGIAAEKALDWPTGSFMAAMQENIRAGDAEALDSSPIPAALAAAIITTWEGSASELHSILRTKVEERVQRQRGWPGNGQALSRALRRLQPNLERTGWRIAVDEKARPKRIRLVRENCDIASQCDGAAPGPLFSSDAIPADSVGTALDCDRAETAPAIEPDAIRRNDAIFLDISGCDDLAALKMRALDLQTFTDGPAPESDRLVRMPEMQALMDRIGEIEGGSP